MAKTATKKKKTRPAQKQHRRPGLETEMKPKPQSSMKGYRGSGKLKGKVALITGGDSGIGRAVAIAFAKEGADVAIVYLNEHNDAETTKRLVEKEGRKCLLIAADLAEEKACKEVIKKTIAKFRKLDILVNNAAEQHPKESIRDISREQLERTFRTNLFSFFYLSREALPHLSEGNVIINTTSVTAYRGSPHLVDYAATKGAIVAFTRSLSKQLASQGIRVNAVAPGPIWTPLIPSTFKTEKVEQFGANTPMERPGEPDEVAPSYVFLASSDSSYMTGQVLHPNGGEVVNA